MDGWISRHDKAKTEEIEEVEPLTEWIQKDIPESPLASIVRNDFKLNNLVLNPEDLTEAPAADLCPLGKGPDEGRALREFFAGIVENIFVGKSGNDIAAKGPQA